MSEDTRHDETEERQDRLSAIEMTEGPDLASVASGDDPPKIKLTDLPIDVLRHVLDCLRDPRVDPTGRINCPKRNDDPNRLANKRAVASSRLACHRLFEVASLYFLPVLDIRLDRPSIEKIKAVSSSRSVASGVLGMEVDLSYRPVGISYNADAYWTHKSIISLRSICYAHIENVSDSHDPKKKHLLHEASVETEAAAHRCFLEFKRLHEEQERIVNRGLLTDMVQKAVSRMPRFSALLLTDKPNDADEPGDTSYQPGSIPRSMISPFSWGEIEAASYMMATPPSGLLLDLPLVIRKAGRKLKWLYIDCFPTKDPSLFTKCNPTAASSRDLRSAFQNLEQVIFALHKSERDIRFRDDFSKDKNGLVEYVSAMLSSPRLESAHVSPQTFSVLRGATMVSTCFLGPALDAMITPHLKRLVLTDAQVSQRDWDTLCRGLSDRLEEVRLVALWLLNGTWRPSLHTLRLKTKSRCEEGKCKLHISELHGGEFEESDKFILVEGWWDCIAKTPFVLEDVRFGY